MRKFIVLAAFVLALAGCSSDEAATAPESEVKPAETTEAKPAEAKDAKAEANAEAAKPAEGEAKDGEAAPQPVVTSPRDFRDVKAEPVYFVTLEADKEYDIGVKGLATSVELKAGDTLRFQLTDLLESGGKWVVRSNDDQVVGVTLGVFKAALEKGVRSVTAVDLKAVKPGTSVLEMNYINRLQSIQRVFRCHITVK